MNRTTSYLECLHDHRAWYGLIRHTPSALWVAIIASWGIAFFEYCLQVPANRLGYNAGLSGTQLKTIQEVITLVVFVLFAAWYLKEPIRWHTIAGFICIAIGATLIFAPWPDKPDPTVKRTTSSAACESRAETTSARHITTSGITYRKDEEQSDGR